MNMFMNIVHKLGAPVGPRGAPVGPRGPPWAPVGPRGAPWGPMGPHRIGDGFKKPFLGNMCFKTVLNGVLGDSLSEPTRVGLDGGP